VTAFATLVADVNSKRCWALKIDAFQIAAPGGMSSQFGDGAFGEYGFAEDDAGAAGGIVSLYYSDNDYTSQAADTPASTIFDGRIVEAPMQIRREMFGMSGVGVLTRISGQIALTNYDGGLDALVASYGLDGRRITVSLGDPADAYANFGTVFAGVIATRPSVKMDTCDILLADASGRLVVPFNTNTYAGTGAAEGGADLKGKPKPLAFGNCLNISAPLVDSALLIYQVHDGLASDVPAAYDRQVVLTKGADYVSYTDMTTNAPAAANYRVLKTATGSYFRLGSTPAGTVTADVLGDATGGYINKTGDIVNRILGTQAGLAAADISAAAIAQLNADQAAEVGIFRGTQGDTVDNVVDELLQNAGAFGGFSRTGPFTCGVIKAPGSVAAADAFSAEDIRSIERQPLPMQVEPIVWRARVGYQKNYTVMTDVAAGVTAARRTFAAEAQRISLKDDTATQSRHRLAREYGPTGALFAQAADGDTEALRRITLWKQELGIYAVNTCGRALLRDLGDEVTITYNRFGFDAGKQVVILGHQVNGADDVTLMVLG